MSDRRLAAAGSRFAVATPHAEATHAAAEVFAAGGNAIDAALAAATTLAVAYPQMCGVGGDLFALLQTPDGRVVSINSSGAAPMALDVEDVRRRNPSMPVRGPDAITVPGAVAGWAALHDLGGRLPWADAFAHAEDLATDGVAVVPGLAESYRDQLALLVADPGMRTVHAPNGTAPLAGETLVNRALGRTLEAIATEGPTALYGGDVGRAYAEGLAALGSAMSIDDLHARTADVLEPLSHRYAEFEIRTSPPTSQGFVLLQALAAVERLGLDPDPLGPDADAFALSFVAAARDRDAHLADPRFMSTPVASLLADARLDELAAEVRDRIRRARAGTPPLGGTAGLVTADADGYAVSLIQSLAWGFGSGILEPETGIIAQNRGSGFTLEPGADNTLAPLKRPAHTLMPVMAHRDGRLAAVSGTMGGPAHPQINAMTLIRALQLGMSASEAVDAPRWIAGGLDAVEGTAVAETGVPDTVVASLEGAGLRVTPLGTHDSSTGHAHLIVVHEGGAFDVGTDRRADGEAAAR
ncbi:MAG: gamma-glutamyltransferase family protein [Actinomycetota bacterium]